MNTQIALHICVDIYYTHIHHQVDQVSFFILPQRRTLKKGAPRVPANSYQANLITNDEKPLAWRFSNFWFANCRTNCPDPRLFPLFARTIHNSANQTKVPRSPCHIQSPPKREQPLQNGLYHKQGRSGEQTAIAADMDCLPGEGEAIFMNRHGRVNIEGPQTVLWLQFKPASTRGPQNTGRIHPCPCVAKRLALRGGILEHAPFGSTYHGCGHQHGVHPRSFWDAAAGTVHCMVFLSLLQC